MMVCVFQKNFLGRRKKLILGYVLKNVKKKKNLVRKGLKQKTRFL